MSAAPRPDRRVANLDLLRALAIVPVVLANAAAEHVVAGTFGRVANLGSARVGRTTFAKRILSAAAEAGDAAVYLRGDFLHGDLRPEAATGH